MSKTELPKDPAVSFWIFTSKHRKQSLAEVFRAVLFTIARRLKPASTPGQMGSGKHMDTIKYPALGSSDTL